MLNQIRRQVRLLAHKCPYCARPLTAAEPVPYAVRTECCPAQHYGEADFGHFIAVFDDGGAAVDLRPDAVTRVRVA